jgi:LysM repeat protein
MIYRIFFFAIANLIYCFTFSQTLQGDSVGITQKNGKNMLVYQVGVKETVYSIARRYQVNPKSILAVNPDILNGIKTGQKIFIPFSLNNEKTDVKPENSVKNQGQPIFHTVAAQQTLYAISRKYNVAVEKIKSWNNIVGNDLKVGSEIIVGFESSEPVKTIPNFKTSDERTDVIKQNEKSASGIEKIVEIGFAEMFETNKGDTFYYALHRSAPIGEIIKVVNESTAQSIFVRVIGTLPSNTASKTVLKISKLAFNKLKSDKETELKVKLSYLPK